MRIIAATNRNLSAMVESGHFREDLYYRLNVVTIEMPPLRERKDEIPALTTHFVNLYSRECDRPGLRVSDDLIAAYHRRLTSDDRAVRLEAARAWAIWEGATSKLIPDPALVDSFGEDVTADL